MKIYVTADLHFGHANIRKFCPETRGRFADTEHMDSQMVVEWNNIVSPQDTVYILGDVAFCKADKAATILNRLNGTKILIEGNHDVKNLTDPAFRACFKEVHKVHEIVHNGNLVVMCHFPFLEWNRMHRGSVHLYGHVHGNKTGLEKFRARDAGMDATGKIVVSMDEIVADAMRGEVKSHH